MAPVLNGAVGRLIPFGGVISRMVSKPRVLLPAALLSLMLLVAACSAHITGSSSTNSATPSSSSLTPGRVTPTTVSACAQVTPTPAANPSYTISGLPQWNDVAYPASTILLTYEDGAGDGVQSSYSFEAVTVCSDGMAPSAVQSFYASALPGHGWIKSATFPYDGDINTACKDQYCWKKAMGAGIITFVTLEHILVANTATIFTVRYLTYNINQ